jgi:hypothetical protein
LNGSDQLVALEEVATMLRRFSLPRRFRIRAVCPALAGAAIVASLALSPGAMADSYTAQPTPLNYANDMQSPAMVYPVDGPGFATARKIADSTWGYDPCGGAIALSWVTAAPTINATASWSNPTDAYNNPQQNGNCSVAFNDQQAYDWPMLCTVFVHEFGHLTGHQHANDQNDVMFPYYVNPIAVCANTPDPQRAIAAPPPPARAKTAIVTKSTTKRSRKGAKRKHRKGHHARTRHRRHHHSRSPSRSPSSAHSRSRAGRPSKPRSQRRTSDPLGDSAAVHSTTYG